MKKKKERKKERKAQCSSIKHHHQPLPSPWVTIQKLKAHTLASTSASILIAYSLHPS